VLAFSRRVVCGVDQATSSGYCIHVGHTPVRWGLARDAFERREVLRQAVMYAEELAARVRATPSPAELLTMGPPPEPWPVFVFENHANVGRRQKGHGTLIGQLHRWLEQLDLMGHPGYLRIGVAPNVWQSAVLGCSTKTPRAERKRQSLAWASGHVKQVITNDDVADAISISRWACLDGLVALDRRRWGASKKARKRVRRRRTA
jgi:hypothetical protein